MQSESGIGGNEHARAREVPIVRRAEERMIPAWVHAQLVLVRTQEKCARAQEDLAQEEWAQEEWAQDLAWAQEDFARAQEDLALVKEKLALVKEEWAQEELARAREQKELAQEEWARGQQELGLERWAQMKALEQDHAREWMQEQEVQEQEEWTRMKTLAQEHAQEWVQEEALARAMWEHEWAQAREWVQVEVEVLVEVRARASATAQAAARAEALARALGQARAGMVHEIPLLVHEIPLLEWLAEQRATPFLPQAVQSHPPTYAEVLADLKIKDILDSIKPRCRQGLARHLWGHSEHWWLIQILTPVTRLPPELLQSILSTIIDDASNSPLVLMFVCKHWYTAVTSIWAPLELGTRTPRDAVTSKLERHPSLLDVVVDTEIDRGDFTLSEASYEAIFAAIEAISRWRSLIVETFPGQADLPEHLVNCGLQRCSNATMSQLKTFKFKSACEISPLLDRLLRILGTTASPELTRVEIYSANIISFLAPAYPPIFRSVKVLTLDISAAHNPVDLLPHLHQLEELTASHLSLPIYPDHINLPFVNTLRHLTLRAVSIQWMSGRTFDSLEICTIIFPLRHQILPIFRTTLPNCRRLTFQGHPLDILDGISAQELDHLSVTSSGSFNKRRAQQSVLFSSQNLAERRLAPQILHIDIEATIQAWMTVLTSMPHLEELVISNACPSSLRAKVLQPLIAQPVHASSTGTTSPYEEWDARLCPSLQRFGLKYHRWLRPSEHFDLIPDILFIISSRQHSNCPLHSFSVWIGGNYHPTFELIDGREGRINESDVELLADKSSIGREDLLRIRQRAATGIPISTIVA